MAIRKKPDWDVPERDATPESLFYRRRKLIAGIAAGSAVVAVPVLIGGVGSGGPDADEIAAAAAADPTAGLYPVARNVAYDAGRPVTPETEALSYNNFYEFGSHKGIARAAQALPLRPWQVRIDGLVENPMTVDIDDLIRRMPLEERVYRFRCVEAWSMTVPWSGFPFRALVDFARPLSGARYVEMQTFENPEIAKGQKQAWYPWPYVEGLTLPEATNELAFLATGAYGRPVARQMGAPLRLAVPWKYGFKSIKSLVRFTFTDRRPRTFWEKIQPREYGFWANVNPEVPHPRWSQATERVLGGGRIPTQKWNGYGAQVAALYKDLAGERLFA